MPLPLLLVGALALVGTVGAAGAASAVSDTKKAKDIGTRAKARLEKAQVRLRKAGDDTNAQLAELGRAKLAACTTTLKRVIAVADRVHVGKDEMKMAAVRGITVSPDTVKDMQDISFKAQDILKSGAAGLTTGALAGVGALGVAVTIGTASTGTAIGALSGAAATNATLAWLGGGALSAGGAGMAGGMMVAGGLVAAPALAIMGIAAAIKAEKGLTEATAYAAKVDVAVEKIRTAVFKTKAIDARAAQIRMAIRMLEDRTRPVLDGAEAMLDARRPGKIPYGDLAEHEQALYKTALALGAALYQVIDVDIIDELGEVTASSAQVLHDASGLMASASAATV